MASSEQVSEVTVVSTTSWQEVTEFGSGYGFTGISLKNYTDGDVLIAFRSTTYPDIVLKQDMLEVLEYLNNVSSPIYVKNLTGSGGNVYIKIWTDHNK